jgi:hypothetical protein
LTLGKKTIGDALINIPLCLVGKKMEQDRTEHGDFSFGHILVVEIDEMERVLVLQQTQMDQLIPV